jgi:uncharacterized membrane protein
MKRLAFLLPQTFLSRAPLSASDVGTWYFALALFAVVPLVLLTPPLQAPDEQQHFFRAYQLSEGNIIGLVRDNQPGAELPSSLAELSDRFLGTRASVPTMENLVTHYQPLRETIRALSAPLDPQRREFVEFVGVASYSPLGYAPQIAGILLARNLGGGPLVLLYAGRLANGLTAILVVAAALSGDFRISDRSVGVVSGRCIGSHEIGVRN